VLARTNFFISISSYNGGAAAIGGPQRHTNDLR